MFQFPRCPPVFAGIQVPLDGLPHSDTSGSQAASASPEQFRRVAASFFGRRRQGIHHAPSCAVMRHLRPSRPHALDRLAPHGLAATRPAPPNQPLRSSSSITALSLVFAALAILRTVRYSSACVSLSF